MGSPRIKAERLGGKLFAVRERLDYSMTEMANALSDDKVTVNRSEINKFEKGFREPPLVILLRYSKLARVRMEIFADDSKDLPW